MISVCLHLFDKVLVLFTEELLPRRLGRQLSIDARGLVGVFSSFVLLIFEFLFLFLAFLLPKIVYSQFKRSDIKFIFVIIFILSDFLDWLNNISLYRQLLM